MDDCGGGEGDEGTEFSDWERLTATKSPSSKCRRTEIETRVYSKRHRGKDGDSDNDDTPEEPQKATTDVFIKKERGMHSL